jgi:hypothetical protein
LLQLELSKFIIGIGPIGVLLNHFSQKRLALLFLLYLNQRKGQMILGGDIGGIKFERSAKLLHRVLGVCAVSSER